MKAIRISTEQMEAIHIIRPLIQLFPIFSSAKFTQQSQQYRLLLPTEEINLWRNSEDIENSRASLRFLLLFDRR